MISPQHEKTSDILANVLVFLSGVDTDDAAFMRGSALNVGVEQPGRETEDLAGLLDKDQANPGVLQRPC